MHARQMLCLGLTTLALAGCATPRRALPGFELSPHFDEQIKSCTFDPDVSVLINAPPANAIDPAKPTELVIYALPNGNTIDQTVGRSEKEGLDWHFYIQHIGAQTRRLREIVTNRNIIVAYVEADGRSWPTWRQKHEDSGAHIVRLVEFLRNEVHTDSVALTAHSGGGSMIFGFINEVNDIPDWVERIAFLDANYAYTDEQHHGDKFIDWLKRSPQHALGVMAYDDRRIKINGKLVVGPTGGTYRKTQKMLDRFQQDLPLSETTLPDHTRYQALDGRLDIVRINNPEDKILHTVMVERNGFIHALTFATPFENQAGDLYGQASYKQWIQGD
ncbi:MAG: hypothetical protein JXO22_09405 [Phycisphaerae bacterium]|nr:hypothetical protein [Phycisphaerae bacterium]